MAKVRTNTTRKDDVRYTNNFQSLDERFTEEENKKRAKTKGHRQRVKDYKVHLGCSIRHSTKHLLILATEEYGFRYLSELVEAVLRIGVIQMLESRGIDWKQSIVDAGILDEDEVEK